MHTVGLSSHDPDQCRWVWKLPQIVQQTLRLLSSHRKDHDYQLCIGLINQWLLVAPSNACGLCGH